MPGSQPTGAGPPDPTLREVAGYHLLRRVGEGGMSTVFLAYDVTAGSPVAVKLLADHLADSREFVNRFYREARLSRLLAHPNLVRGLAAGYDSVAAKHYLILEFIDGPTAHAALGRLGRFPVGVAVQVGLDIARALGFLHSRRYVHRDVKPDNVLLHPDGVAKLADLGLAKRLNDDAQITSTSQGVGTSYYMAYEQALNANLVDGRSDIFALGATLYHLLTGEVPFPGATHEEVVRGKEGDAFRPARELNADIPLPLAEIIARSLARDPRARFQSAGELAAALEATGLATRIPALPQSDPDADGGPDSGPEIPTRADLKTVQRDGPAAPTPPTESFTRGALPRANFSRAPASRRFRWLLGACAAVGVTGFALGGLLASKLKSDPGAPGQRPSETHLIPRRVAPRCPPRNNRRDASDTDTPRDPWIGFQPVRSDHHGLATGGGSVMLGVFGGCWHAPARAATTPPSGRGRFQGDAHVHGSGGAGAGGGGG
jgi:eukaryotic-like serine/threonine-protein kinase